MPQWRKDPDVWHAFTLPGAPIKGVGPRSRGAYARVMSERFAPREMRARGMPDARHTRSLVCSKKTRVSHHRFTGTPDIPCAMDLTVSLVLSPVNGLGCHARIWLGG